MDQREVFVIGDSISVQYFPHLRRFLEGVCSVARKEDGECPGEGVRPGTNNGNSAMVLAYVQWLRHVGDFSPDVVLLNCGLWDVKTDPRTGAKEVPIDAYQVNLQQITAILAEMGVLTAWMRTTPVDEAIHNRISQGFHRFGADVHAYNAAADAIMRALGIPVIDLHLVTGRLGAPEEIFCDHVHFTEEVREKQALFLAGCVSALLERM